MISWIEVDGATTIDRFNTAGDPHTVTMTWAITSNGSLSVNAVDSWNYSYLETSTWTHIGDDFSMTDNNTGETQDFTISTLNKNNLVIFGTLDDGDGNMADHTISFTR